MGFSCRFVKGMGSGDSKPAGDGALQVAARLYGHPGTLYARCGGVFGVSAFVDRLMDRWMEDKTLNDNKLVARWHESAQRPGFKFLVVQLLCSLIGGPQECASAFAMRLTRSLASINHHQCLPSSTTTLWSLASMRARSAAVRPACSSQTRAAMDVSHKPQHLGRGWAQFMAIFHDVCGEFALARGRRRSRRAARVDEGRLRCRRGRAAVARARAAVRAAARVQARGRRVPDRALRRPARRRAASRRA